VKGDQIMYLTNHTNVSDFIKEVQDLFLPHSLFKDSYQDEFTGYIPLKFHPQVAIKEGDNHVKIELATPGYKKEELKISIQEATLTIEGSQNNTEDKSKQDKSFSKSLTIGSHYDIENAKSQYENGILSIVIDKKEEKKAKELPIS
tara:strand:+ start:320 stop:757 length:438 start_codon:yes stop_codon:yes gene_type:complete